MARRRMTALYKGRRNVVLLPTCGTKIYQYTISCELKRSQLAMLFLAKQLCTLRLYNLCLGFELALVVVGDGARARGDNSAGRHREPAARPKYRSADSAVVAGRGEPAAPTGSFAPAPARYIDTGSLQASKPLGLELDPLSHWCPAAISASHHNRSPAPILVSSFLTF